MSQGAQANEAPLLVAQRARIAVDDVLSIDGLELRTSGRCLVLVGSYGPLISALMGIPSGVTAAATHAATFQELVPVAGQGRAVAGELALAGKDVVLREHLAHVGAAPYEPPVPPGWSVEAYVAQTARLALASRADQVSRGELARRTTAALELTGLAGSRRKPARGLPIAERRVLGLAAALACDPLAIVADRPLADLDQQTAPFVLGALQAVAQRCPLVVGLARITPGTPEGTFARTASDLAAFAGGELTMFGRPEQVFEGKKLFRVTVRTNAAALQSALAERGASLEGGPTRFTLRLVDDQDPSFVLALASELRSAVVEILPVV